MKNAGLFYNRKKSADIVEKYPASSVTINAWRYVFAYTTQMFVLSHIINFYEVFSRIVNFYDAVLLLSLQVYNTPRKQPFARVISYKKYIHRYMAAQHIYI